ncbi:MAG: hypothetical protein ABIP93_01160 [Gemmatimonadaceae bacterium]
MTRSRRLAAVLAVAVAAGFGAHNADAALAPGAKTPRTNARMGDCWADVSYPAHIGNNTETTITWQCTNGTPQQIAPLASLTSPSGTKTNVSRQCYGTSSCAITVSVPWSSGTWTAKADYAYVVAWDGSASYYWGGTIAQYLPY